MKKMPRLVLVEWVDSHSGRGWRSFEDFEEIAEPLYCQSVGWLVIDKKDCKVIVPHIGGERNGNVLLQGCGDITIPARAITKITSLKL